MHHFSSPPLLRVELACNHSSCFKMFQAKPFFTSEDLDQLVSKRREEERSSSRYSRVLPAVGLATFPMGASKEARERFAL